jgi:hypothetical protein
MCRRQKAQWRPRKIASSSGFLPRERVGQPAQQFVGAAVGDDVAGDLAREPDHAREQPGWGLAAV